MLKVIFVSALAAMLAASSPQAAFMSADKESRTHSFIPVVYNDDYGHWLKCADIAGMCGIALSAQ